MGKGTIYRRKDGRWEARIPLGKDKGGKRLSRSFYGSTREEAEYKMSTFLQRDEFYAVTEMTVKELTLEWLFIMNQKIKQSTAANYRMKAEKHIIPSFGSINCNMLKAADIYHFIEKKLKAGLSARYVFDIVVLMKSIYRYASRIYRIKNVLDGLTMPKRSKTEVDMLNSEQQAKLDEYIQNSNSLTALGIAISKYMGLRIGEVCALQWSDVNIEKRIITVRKTVQRIQCFGEKKRTKIVVTEPKSASSVREIPIPSRLIPMLMRCKSSQEKYVISGSMKPLEPRAMQYRFARILRNENLPSVHFHSLRHSFATNCIALGFDVKTLSEILGHSSVEITLNRYVHSSIERKRACMDLLSVGF